MALLIGDLRPHTKNMFAFLNNCYEKMVLIIKNQHLNGSEHPFKNVYIFNYQNQSTGTVPVHFFILIV